MAVLALRLGVYGGLGYMLPERGMTVTFANKLKCSLMHSHKERDVRCSKESVK